MRHILTFFAIALLGLAVLTACNSAEQTASKSSPLAAASPATKAPPDGVRRVTVAELKDMLAKNEAVVIDVRSEDTYKAAHIKGAKLIPEVEVVKRSDELPKDKLIVTYCSWPNEHTSARAVADLKAKGIENAAALLGGFMAWQNAGLPVEASQPVVKDSKETPVPTPSPAPNQTPKQSPKPAHKP